MGKNDIGCDAVIIGSAMGGSTFAYGLAKRGFDVVVVEQGELIKHDSPDLTPLHFVNFGNPSWVGGPTKMFGAALYRFRERDFVDTQMEAGVSPGWPITYSDLEPFYGEAERLYKVHGSSVGDKTEPPRSTNWPHAPIPHQGPVKELVSRVTERAGIPVAFIPRGLDFDPSANGKSPCKLCQHCDSYFCPRDAKMDAEIAALRPAIKTGNVRLLTGTECLRVITTPDGKRVTGIRARRENQEFTINAALVSMSAGLTGTPIILWRSRSTKHPHGLGNGSRTMGRYLAAHTQGWILPVKLGVQRTPFHQKTFAINEFYNGAPNWPYPTGVIQAAGYAPPLSLSRRFRPFAAAMLHNSFQTFIMTEGLPSAGSGFDIRDDGATLVAPPVQNTATFAKLRKLATELFRAAGYVVVAPRFMHFQWHNVGTARMGSDPASSIVDANCKSHEVEGLYVIDSSTLPSAGAVNSGLTIAAVALRAAANAPIK